MRLTALLIIVLFTLYNTIEYFPQSELSHLTMGRNDFRATRVFKLQYLEQF